VANYFQDKKVLITGAANGIGRLMAYEIAEKGGYVILFDINGEALELTTQAIQERGGRAAAYFCDISKPDMISFFYKKVQDEIGSIDILINNAGKVNGKTILDSLPSEMEKTMQVNALGPMWLIHEILPDMIQRNAGHIVNISSAAGLIGVNKLADYSASKFALFGFDESLRAELKEIDSDVKTTIICPYFIDTGLFAGVRTRFSFLLPILKEEKAARRIVKTIEKKRKRLFMPAMVYTVPLLRILPTAAFDAIARFFGINQTMDHFTGRK